ncbi:MAG: tetratricopeptide repeat protein [Bacteroidales bacterium]|nr:tetratricopeptide repeat protein [Bacteroidales bacterium]
MRLTFITEAKKRRRFYFNYLILLMFIFNISDGAEIDSLLNQLTIVKEKDKVSTLINISRYYYIHGDSIGIKYAREAVDTSIIMDYVEGIGQAQLFLGLTYDIFNSDSALKYYILSSDNLVKLNHPWTSYGYINATNVYIDKGWFPEALEYALKTLEVNELEADTVKMAKIMSLIGYIHNKLNNYNEAYDWQKKALKILGTKEEYEQIGLIYGRIGILFDEQEIFDSAFYYNRKAVNYFNKAGTLFYVSQWMSNIGNTYIKLGKWNEAEKYLTQSINGYLDDDQKAIVYNNLAKVYIETRRFNKAKQMLDSAAFLAKNFKQNIFLNETWYRYYELNQAKGNIPEALKYYIKYASLKDSMLNIKKTEQIAQMQVRFDTEQKEKELILEKAEKERIEKEYYIARLSASKRQKWIWAVSVFAIIIILIVLIVMQRIKQRAVEEKDQAIIHEKEKGLEAVIFAQEEERKRVAKELHDGVGQQISAINLNFQVLVKKIISISEDLKPETDKIKSLIIDTANDVRTISHQMMPRALTEYGLVEALEDMLEKSFSGGEISYNFQHSNMDERLPQNIEIGLYRITQELINNIIKHSEATLVEIQLIKNDTHCILMVHDNGKGIDSEKSDGIGILNMNSRINALKGELNLESDAANGTTAIVKIKL